jgi:hypothetical protein
MISLTTHLGPCQIGSIEQLLTLVSETVESITFATFAQLVDLRFYCTPDSGQDQEGLKSETFYQCDLSDHTGTLLDVKVGSLSDVPALAHLVAQIRNADSNLEPLLQVPPRSNLASCMSVVIGLTAGREIAGLSEEDWRALRMGCLFQPLKFVLQVRFPCLSDHRSWYHCTSETMFHLLHYPLRPRRAPARWLASSSPTSRSLWPRSWPRRISPNLSSPAS